jgi:hypothetical protein
MANDTSCSRAANATARRGSLCRVSPRPHLVFQVPQMCWHHLSVHYGPSVGPLGASCREVARSAKMGKERREACRRERTSESWGCWPTTRLYESRGRVTLDTTGQISIVPIYGGNAEMDLLTLVVGQFVDKAGGASQLASHQRCPGCPPRSDPDRSCTTPGRPLIWKAVPELMELRSPIRRWRRRRKEQKRLS